MEEGARLVGVEAARADSALDVRHANEEVEEDVAVEGQHAEHSEHDPPTEPLGAIAAEVIMGAVIELVDRLDQRLRHGVECSSGARRSDGGRGTAQPA